MDDAWVLPAFPVAAFVILLLVEPVPARARATGSPSPVMGRAFVPDAASSRSTCSDAIGKRCRRLPRRRTAAGSGSTSPAYLEIRMGTFVDQITLVMLFCVTLVALLVMIYSTGYMHGDRRYGWFFADRLAVRRVDADAGAGRQPAAALLRLGAASGSARSCSSATTTRSSRRPRRRRRRSSRRASATSAC